MISIVIEPTTFGERGQRYRVTYLGGVLVESSRNPEFDARRALLARRITGRMEVRRPGQGVCGYAPGHRAKCQADDPRNR
jgi:hypothetical protein